jgi:hypothetical protein
MAPGVAGWMVPGVVYLWYLYVGHPQRVTEVGLVHPGEVPGEAEVINEGR